MEANLPQPQRYPHHSSFFFTDDLILLAEASMEQGTVINEVLDTFCVSSSKKMNKKRPKFSFLIMLFRQRLVGSARVQVLLSQKVWVTIQGCPFFILEWRRTITEQFQMKWGIGFQAGIDSIYPLRIMLTQSVLQAILVYSMQTTKLPTSV